MNAEEKYQKMRRAAVLMTGVEDNEEKQLELARQLVALGADKDPDGQITLNLVRVLIETGKADG
jgi:hypothetical protein